jgi:hypothetical protein
MQFTTLALVSAYSLYALLGEMTPAKVLAGAIAPLTFWPGLFVAWSIRGTDVYASEELRQFGVPINVLLAALFLLMTTCGLWVGMRHPAASTLDPLHHSPAK